MNPTKNNLPEATRATMIGLLNDALADTIDLFNQVKQAHWNVKGMSFIALHELFDDVAEHVEEWSDDIAERAVQLGGQAEGTIQIVAKRTTLPAYDLTMNDGHEHVDAIATALSTFGAMTRRGIDTADKAGDKDTADLFTEVSRGADKDLWFVEAHLQNKKR
ncbi:MAG: DNA starvation/stationary phase protection protein Dps [Clostridia bacterium]|nr:DNA starvation/stationary phase protection protein Dps [Deltaproteobacteria bacterium]